MCPLKDSGSFHGPSGFVPLGRPAALPAGWGSVGVDPRQGKRRIVRGRRNPREYDRAPRAYGTHTPALTPDGTTGPTEPTAPTFLHRLCDIDNLAGVSTSHSAAPH